VHSIVLEIPLNFANGGMAPITTGATVAQATAQTVGVWASASRRKSTIRRRAGGETSFGPWIQVSREGLPLINEAIIGVQDKDFYNHLTPADDVANFAAYFLNPIVVRDAQAISFYGAGNPLAGCSTMGGNDLTSGRMDIIGVINLAPAHNIPLTSTGDVLRVDLGLPSGFPNGRNLTDEVTTTELALLLCGAANLGLTAPGMPLHGAAGPTANEAPFKATFPFLAPPWEGRSAQPRPANNLLSQAGAPCTAAGAANCASGVCIPVVLTCQ
jgi:hypothetical protein